MTAIALHNGRPTANIPVTDRGFCYGDGLFETIKVIDGRPQFLSQHLHRLARDCVRLDINLDMSALRNEIAQLLLPHHSGVLKIIVTRAANGRGYQTPRNAGGERTVLFFPQMILANASLATGVAVRLCRQRLAEQPVLAGMKHLNRLEQVLARAEWSDPTIAEGLMLDRQGRLIEGTMSNVFLVRGDTVYTPRLHRCGVAGVMREIVLTRLAISSAPVVEDDLLLDDVYAADEVFLTNSIIGIWPVTKIECLHKRRGDVTIAFQRSLHDLVANEFS